MSASSNDYTVTEVIANYVNKGLESPLFTFEQYELVLAASRWTRCSVPSYPKWVAEHIQNPDSILTARAALVGNNESDFMDFHDELGHALRSIEAFEVCEPSFYEVQSSLGVRCTVAMEVDLVDAEGSVRLPNLEKRPSIIRLAVTPVAELSLAIASLTDDTSLAEINNELYLAMRVFVPVVGSQELQSKAVAAMFARFNDISDKFPGVALQYVNEASFVTETCCILLATVPVRVLPANAPEFMERLWLTMESLTLDVGYA